jgi:phosphatidylglycerophosphate synthase
MLRLIQKSSTYMSDEKNPKSINEIGILLFRSSPAMIIVNTITLYRIVTFPVLLIFLFAGNIVVFKWLLLASFFTDAIDGVLARTYGATSILGSKLDSIGDDLTILAATIGLLITRFDFIREQAAVFLFLFALFLFQVAMAFYRYKKISTFHTYLAKTAAVVTAIFLLSVFFLESVYYPLFYAAAIITGAELIEEIILVFKLREYRSNVKGLFWVLRQQRDAGTGESDRGAHEVRPYDRKLPF